MSFADSFLDFDSLKAWFEDIPNPNMADEAKVKIGVVEEDSCGETTVQEHVTNGSDSNVIGSKPVVDGSGPINPGSLDVVELEERECQLSGTLNCSIEEEIGKVTLVCGSEASFIVGENDMKSEVMDINGVKGETVSDEAESESSESEGTSTSSLSSPSSCSSSDDDDHDKGHHHDAEEKEKDEEKEDMKVQADRKFNEAGEVEEGEIRDADGPDMAGQTDDGDDNDGNDDDDSDDNHEEAMVCWSDADVDDDEEDGGGATKGPIKSKNELTVLPSVPPVAASLLPHHQMLPVGVVLSIIGNQVIVEGVEKHDPLNDGSILWITESRSPLGLVDEIFGPVKNPYYVVRYNSESEVPAGIHAGTLISFVPDFASHVLKNMDIYKKGYDASGANDEELSDEAEFSDDEKEAEYKKIQKMTKRGTNDRKPRNNKNDRKKVKNRVEPWKNGKHSSRQTPTDPRHVPPNQHQHNFSPLSLSLSAVADHGNCSTSFTVGQGLVGGAGLAPPFPPMVQAACINAPPNVVWANGMPFQQPQGAFVPNGFPTYGMPWLASNSQQFPYQMGMQNRIPFPQQQVDPSQRLHSTTMLPGEQSNTLAASTYAQGLVGQSGFNQVPFGIGLQGQLSQSTLNIGEQGISIGQNCKVPQSGGIPGNNEASFQFNLGPSGRGRNPYRRGGGRFAGGKGRNQSG